MAAMPVLPVLARYYDQRQAAPRQRAVNAPPDPRRLVEQFQRQFADVGSAEHAAVEPPGWRADLIQAAKFLHFHAGLLNQTDDFRALEAALMAHSAVERAV